MTDSYRYFHTSSYDTSSYDGGCASALEPGVHNYHQDASEGDYRNRNSSASWPQEDGDVRTMVK